MSLPIGRYAFVDGDTTGGVGHVVVEVDTDGFSVSETSTSVMTLFRAAGLPGLESELQVKDALSLKALRC